MLTRRELLATTATTATTFSAAAATAALTAAASASGAGPAPGPRPGAVAVASRNGLKAVEKAMERMRAGADPLDAAIDGVALAEDDPNEMTVGLGGVPNEDCVVQLDACVMHGPTGRAGAVASLEGVKNPSRVAKKVMETTDHVLLVGPGARRFAELHGFPIQNLLTEKARKVWLYWKQNLSGRDKWLEPDPAQLDPEVRDFIQEYGSDPFRDPRSHGTIHLSANDGKGALAGCTSTSGLFFKMPGRVGDSPLIGAGCFTDNEVGSAGSTGRGEANILVCGAHTVVELMRHGRSPREACLEVLDRIARTTRDRRLLTPRGKPAFGIHFYAVNRDGAYGAAAMWQLRVNGKPAEFAVADGRGARLEPCAYLLDGKPDT
jgi:N4-(beta-N-acetylglucosaminyl)-L-asparaginase